jgi:hypothetical protein
MPGKGRPSDDAILLQHTFYTEDIQPGKGPHDHDAQRMTSAGRVSENCDWGR